MKKLLLSAVLFSILFFSSSNIFANDFSDKQKKQISDNLQKGVRSLNEGIRISSAKRIFEFIDHENFSNETFSGAVIPLLKMLRNGSSELERITAALALFKIEDGRGIYLLRGTAKFDESSRVREIGKNLYYSYHVMNGSSSIDF